jgi:hypothetical protein
MTGTYIDKGLAMPDFNEMKLSGWRANFDR